MKLPSVRYIRIITFCLFMACGVGHVQGKVNNESAAPATLRSIVISPDGSQVEISATKPLIYTFYKTTAPPKAVIDLAQTEPGAIRTPIEVNAGNIKRIEIAKHGFGTGFLSRIEILMNKDEEPAVAPAAEKDKLLVTFAKQPATTPRTPVSEVQAKAEQPQAAAAGGPASVGEKTSVGSEVKETKVERPSATAADAKPTAEREEPGIRQPAVKEAAVVSQPKKLTAITTVKDGIEIVAAGMERYTYFKLDKPERLIVDLYGIKNASVPRIVAVNSFGVGNARVGLNPDKVRVVLDFPKGQVPSYEVLKTENGLKVRLSGAVPSAGKAGQEKQKQPAEAAASKPSMVNTIDFKLLDGYARIAVKTGEACSAGKPAKNPQGWLLTIDNCQIPAKLQRMVDTSAFAGPVKSITPYQVRSRGKYSAKILVKTRYAAQFDFKQEGASVFWDFRIPETAEAPLMSEVVKTPVALPGAAPRELKVPPAEQPQSVVVAPGGKKTYTGRKVTLEFSDADIRKIFQLIAEVSNLNFLIADDVTGTISIKLVNVPWDQALDVILESKGLEMKRDGNIVQIKPAGKFKTIEQGELEAKRAKERAMELHTVVFDINYAAVSDVVSQLNSLKTQRDGVSISQDARTNRVIVTDIAPAIEKMKTLLKALDIPEKQVMIEARIVEASSSFTRDLGVQWGVHYADGSASFLGINQLDAGFGGIVTPPPTSGTSGPGAAVGMSFGKLTSNVQLDLRLSAAATNGQVKLISTPKVVTLNNKAAKISQGQSIPYQTTSAEGTKTEFIEAALTLEVTPHITADGNIGMKIKASNNSPGAGTPPPINKKEATTELQVRNGETTVIGGIYVDSDTETDTGVPFLQDIPVLGWLLKSNTKTKIKTELLIFITPRIVN